MKAKALVTGAGGLIGSACVQTLCEEGWDVIGIDNDGRSVFSVPWQHRGNRRMAVVFLPELPSFPLGYPEPSGATSTTFKCPLVFFGVAALPGRSMRLQSFMDIGLHRALRRLGEALHNTWL